MLNQILALAITVSPFHPLETQNLFSIVLQGKRSNKKCPPLELGGEAIFFLPFSWKPMAGRANAGRPWKLVPLFNGRDWSPKTTSPQPFLPSSLSFFLLSQCSSPPLLSAPSQPIFRTGSVWTENQAQSGLFTCYQDKRPSWEAAFHNCQGWGSLLPHSSCLSVE